MIGQKEVLKQINNLIEKGFPRFVIITGQKGQGKTELAKYINSKLENYYLIKGYNKCDMIEIGIKIDDIREMIEMAYKQTEPIIYLIQYADKMSLGAKNSLLKVIEEPPNNAIFIMELQQIENTLETIKSRCQEIKMENYNVLELHEMRKKINSNLSLREQSIIESIARNYYQLTLFNNYGVEEFYSYVEKVVDNIYKVQSANSFKLAEKLNLTDEENGYDLNLFFETYEDICRTRFVNLSFDDLYKYSIYVKNIEITSKYQQKLNINRNK